MELTGNLHLSKMELEKLAIAIAKNICELQAIHKFNKPENLGKLWGMPGANTEVANREKLAALISTVVAPNNIEVISLGKDECATLIIKGKDKKSVTKTIKAAARICVIEEKAN